MSIRKSAAPPACIAALSFFVATLLALCPPAAWAGLRPIVGTVIAVADGDTITVLTEAGRRIRVRLFGIDAPETRHRDRPGQAWGRKAREALKEKVFRAAVQVEPVDIDSYGRLVGVVRIGGRNINAEMVAEGHAWAYRRFLGGPYASSFLELERAARRKRLGLWREPNPLPPWEFKQRIGVGR